MEMKAAKMASVTSMEPMLLEEQLHDLDDVATDLIAKANAVAGRLHPVIRAGVGNLVRSMNCYYSNLIEGHNTLPVDIDRALAGDFAEDKNKRDLQIEARAHIEVQRIIDRGDAPAPPVSQEFILWVHKEFCERMPADLLIVQNPESGETLRVVAGQLRTRHVKVGARTPLIRPTCRDSSSASPKRTTRHSFRSCAK